MPNFGKSMADRMKQLNPGNLPSATGMAWYTQDTYLQCLAIFSDATDLHDTFDEWIVAAKRTENQLSQQGMKVIRVEIDPATFPAWCVKNGYRNIDTDARTHFANLKAAESLGLKPK